MSEPRYIIGIDPDSEAHGFALYECGIMIALTNKTLMQIIEFIQYGNADAMMFSVENNLAVNAVFSKNAQRSKAPHAKVALCVGRVQQAQTELMRALDYHNVPYMLQKNSSVWKDTKEKAQFEKVTGWTKNSNADTRSAAYMGWLMVRGK